MCKQKIGNTLVRVDLIFHARKAVPFVFVDLRINRAATFLDGLNDLLCL